VSGPAVGSGGGTPGGDPASEGDGVLERSLRIAAPPETVWQYWVDPGRMTQWWGVSAELEARPGGACRVAMAQGPVMEGEFVEVVPHERLVFTFGWTTPPPGGTPVPPASTRVEVTLVPDGDGTLLTLRHHGLPADQVGEHTEGWSHFLGVLAGTAAG